MRVALWLLLSLSLSSFVSSCSAMQTVRSKEILLLDVANRSHSVVLQPFATYRTRSVTKSTDYKERTTSSMAKSIISRPASTSKTPQESNPEFPWWSYLTVLQTQTDRKTARFYGKATRIECRGSCWAGEGEWRDSGTDEGAFVVCFDFVSQL